MTPQEAKRVIESLARGVDPETGEVLPDDNPIHSPNVIRALFLAANALSADPVKNTRSKAPKPEQTGKSWSATEEEQLLTGFDSGVDVGALAERHHRTAGGIKARLARHGRLIPEQT